MPLTSAEKMRAMRARNIEAGLCEHSAKHGPATRGKQCQDCYQNGLRLRRRHRGKDVDLESLVSVAQAFRTWQMAALKHCGRVKPDEERGLFFLMDLSVFVEFSVPEELTEESRIEIVMRRALAPRVKIANFCLSWSEFEPSDVGEIIIASAQRGA